MVLEAGARLGPYEIISPLGAGGMGEVYKARDTRLERVVAIKVLPEALAADPQFRERFDREARTISQLDHPNICALYDVGDHEGMAYLVMQYLEGESLDARLKRAIPLDEALGIAIEIGLALDKAHRAGIVHRDLKPANIFLARTDASSPRVAKLLDFGLAKGGAPPVGNASGTMLPTTPVNITAQGTILGTFQYMAPEQLEGAEADARTDIFAFGAVVYEMITGRKAFEGKSQVSLIGAIFEREPTPIASLVSSVPPTLDRIVRRCLAKDSDRRWQTASDLTQELRWLAESAAAHETDAPLVTPHPSTQLGLKASFWWRVATAASAAAVVAALWLAYASRAATPEVMRFYVNPPAKMSFVSGGRPGASAAISPDGRRIAFTLQDAAQRISLWVRSIDALTLEPLPGTEDAMFPFWSPDSRSIAYFTRDKLMKIDVSGGPPQTLCDAPNGRGGAWSRHGDILFAVGNGALSRVPAAGGQPVAVTKMSPGQNDHRFPSFPPDDRHFLFFANVGLAVVSELSGLYVGSLDSPDTARVVAGAESSGVYAAGHVLFVRQSTLLAQSFSLTTFQTSGDPVPVADGVTRIYGGLVAFSVADNGTLAYGIGPSSPLGGVVQLTWLDRQGNVIDPIGPPAPYRGLDVSPDGKRVAVHRHDGDGGDIWILDGPRTERFTFEPASENQSPVWSRDGQWIAFARRSEKSAIYRKQASGEGSEELLKETAVPSLPEDWSSTGQALVFRRGLGDVFKLPLSGGAEPVAVSNTPAIELHAQVSPDGSWVAFQAAEGAARPEIYVRPLSGGSAKYQVSTGGGAFPRWRGDGRELFYLEATPAMAAYGRVMAVDITPSRTSFVRGAPHPLFESLNVTFPHVPYRAWAVSPNGQRFLIPRAGSALTDRALDAPVVIVPNWASTLRER